MEQAALLTNFNTQLDEYSRHREYIRRAQTQASKFSRAVVEKVILDHEIKASAVADEILPLVPQMEAAIAAIDTERSGIDAEKASADEQMEELQLRQAIGEMTDAEFDEASAGLRGTIDQANTRLEALSADRGQLATALERWVALATEGGQDSGIRKPEPAPAPQEIAPEDEISVIPDEDEGYGSGAHAQEDVSPVFDQHAAPRAEPDEAIEAGEADVDFGFEEEAGPATSGGDQVGGEVELNLVDNRRPVEARDEIGIDLDQAAPEARPAEAEAEEAFRRALLLYQEGTAEEQIYPFTGEVLTIGRGRDNDIQIKNDSKVSRFHCKLFRRGNNFYVEDNKSSNGTLVNGELITERRLFGGEEIIIGETFFRFRIM